MSASHAGEYPEPKAITAKVLYIAQSQEAAEAFERILTHAFELATHAVVESLKGAVQIVEEVELPPTQIKKRDEV